MSTTSQTASVQLLRAQAHDDGFHSSDQLADRVHRGELLRVRRGVYIDAAPENSENRPPETAPSGHPHARSFFLD